MTIHSPGQTSDSDDPFVKKCPNCGQEWTIEELISSPEIRPMGLVMDPDVDEFSVYYFNHDIDGCGTTFVVSVEIMAPYVGEVDTEESIMGSDACQCLCTRMDDWSFCLQSCANVPYRRFLLEMAKRKGMTVPTE